MRLSASSQRNRRRGRLVFPPFPPEAPRAGRRSLRRLFGAARSSGRTGPEKISRKWFPVPPEKQPEGGK
ncbi:MAG: hypothetical protein CW346_13745 [Bacillaceae bacterium]|nr:hypothetical protein [Bacillaceae bacterium]